MRYVFAFVLMLGGAFGAWAQAPEHPGRIGIWAAPGKLGDIGPATAPDNLTINGNLNVLGTISGNPPGSGSVLAPNLQIIDKQTAAITTEGYSVGAFSQPGATAQQVWGNLFGPTPGPYDAVRGVAVATPGSTSLNVNGVAGYVFNNMTPSAHMTGNSVAFFGAAMNNINDGAVWGINTIVSDCNSKTACPGRTGAQLWNEFDFNVQSADTVVEGLTLAGAGYGVPKRAFGFICQSIDLFRISGALWDYCAYSFDGASKNAIYIGALKYGDDAARANTGSQGAVWGYYDENANRELIWAHIDPGPPWANLVWSGTHGEEVRFDLTMGLGLQPGGGGPNRPSVSQLWHFTDASGNPRAYQMGVNNKSELVLSSSLPNSNMNIFAVNGMLELPHITPLGTAPGASLVRFEVVNGSTPGTCQLIVRGGTSATPVTIADNIGAGC